MTQDIDLVIGVSILSSQIKMKPSVSEKSDEMLQIFSSETFLEISLSSLSESFQYWTSSLGLVASVFIPIMTPKAVDYVN